CRKQRRVGRDDEALADHDRLERLLVDLEPVDALALDALQLELAEQLRRGFAILGRIEIRGDHAVAGGAARRLREEEARLNPLLAVTIEKDLEDVITHRRCRNGRDSLPSPPARPRPRDRTRSAPRAGCAA